LLPREPTRARHPPPRPGRGRTAAATELLRHLVREGRRPDMRREVARRIPRRTAAAPGFPRRNDYIECRMAWQRFCAATPTTRKGSRQARRA
jgi:hypothetical protein